MSSARGGISDGGAVPKHRCEPYQKIMENEKNEKVRERRKLAAQKRAKVVTARKVTVLCYAARVRWLSSLADNEFLQYDFYLPF